MTCRTTDHDRSVHCLEATMMLCNALFLVRKGSLLSHAQQADGPLLRVSKEGAMW